MGVALLPMPQKYLVNWATSELAIKDEGQTTEREIVNCYSPFPRIPWTHIRVILLKQKHQSEGQEPLKYPRRTLGLEQQNGVNCFVSHKNSEVQWLGSKLTLKVLVPSLPLVDMG